MLLNMKKLLLAYLMSHASCIDGNQGILVLSGKLAPAGETTGRGQVELSINTALYKSG